MATAATERYIYTQDSVYVQGSGNMSATYSDRLKLTWTPSVITGTNRTTINVTVTLERGSSYPSQGTRYVSNVTVSISNLNGGSSNKSSITILSGGSSYYSNGTTINTGSFEITQTGTTEPSFRLTLTGSLGQTSPVQYSANKDFSIEVATTACSWASGATVTTNGYAIPGAKLTVSWSGATGGVNNNISAYDIYYRISSTGALPTESNRTLATTYTTSAVSGSTTITVPNDDSKRGQKIAVAMVIKGSAGSTYYSSMQTQTNTPVVINTRPNTPTVTSSPTAINMVTTSVTLTGITTSHNSGIDTGQTLKIRYAKSTVSSPTTNNTTVIDNGGSFTTTEAGTWKFWGYDGYEFSTQAYTFTTTKDVTPVCTSTGVSTTTYTAGSTQASYTKSVSIACVYTNLKPSSSNNTNTTIIYYTTNGSAVSESSATCSIQASITAASNGTESRTLTITQNWLKTLGLTVGTNPINFKAKMQISNGSGTNSWQWLGSNGFVSSFSNATTYTYAAAPSLTDHINRKADSNVGNSSYFSRGLRLKFYEDTSFTSYSVTATTGSTSYTGTIDATSVDNTTHKRTIDVSFGDNVVSSTALTITLTLSNSYISTSMTTTYTRILIPTMSNLSFGGSNLVTIYPFTASGTSQLSIQWPFGSSTSISDAKGNTKYALPDSYIAVRYTSTSSRSDTDLTWTKSGDYLQTTVNLAGMYKWNRDLGITNYSGVVNVTMEVVITNIYGDEFAISKTLQYNFNTSPTSLSVTNVQYKTTGSYSNLGTGSIKEGYTLKFSIGATSYTKGTYDYTLSNSVLGMSITGNVSSGVTSQASGETSVPSQSLTATIELSSALGELAATSYDWIVTLKLRTLSESISATKTTPAVRQTTPSLVLSKCTYNNSQFTYVYEVSDTGLGSTGSITTYISDGTNEYSSALSNVSATVNDTRPSETWEVKNFCIKIVSVAATTKTYYSNYITVYKLTPTVAYRKNFLGINTSAPSSAAVLDIHGASGKDTILITGVGNTTTVWTLTLSEGSIAVASGGTINLKKGYID